MSHNEVSTVCGHRKTQPSHVYLPYIGVVWVVHGRGFPAQETPPNLILLTINMTHRYCGGNALTAVSGDCLAGYYCTSGSIIENPADQAYGDICPAGHYCETGSPWPEPCPTGTYYGAEVSCKDRLQMISKCGETNRATCTSLSAPVCPSMALILGSQA